MDQLFQIATCFQTYGTSGRQVSAGIAITGNFSPFMTELLTQAKHEKRGHSTAFASWSDNHRKKAEEGGLRVTDNLTGIRHTWKVVQDLVLRTIFPVKLILIESTSRQQMATYKSPNQP